MMEKVKMTTRLKDEIAAALEECALQRKLTADLQQKLETSVVALTNSIAGVIRGFERDDEVQEYVRQMTEHAVAEAFKVLRKIREAKF
jgi:hypothetical protein